MKILYISSLVFKKSSSASIRNIGLINGLVHEGHEVDVLSIDYGENGTDSFLLNDLSSSLRIFNTMIPILLTYSNIKKDQEKFTKMLSKLSGLKALYKTLFYFPDVDKDWIELVNTQNIDNDYDIIISSSDSKTSHFVAEKVLNNSSMKATWVQIWGDPWEEDVNLSTFEKKRVAKYECQLLQSADYVMYVSIPTTKLMENKYPHFKNKIHYLGRSYLKKVHGRELGTEQEWELLYTGSLQDRTSVV